MADIVLVNLVTLILASKVNELSFCLFISHYMQFTGAARLCILTSRWVLLAMHEYLIIENKTRELFNK